MTPTQASLLWEMRDFHGWTVGGRAFDRKFDVQPNNDCTRIALGDEKKWHELMAALIAPFTSAEVQYFDLHERDSALAWLKEGAAP